MEKVRVLLTCIGGKFSFDTINAFKQSKEPEIEIIGTDTNKDVALRHMVTSFYPVPKGSLWPVKVPKILEICKKEGVKIIIPCADEEVGAVAKNRGLFEKNNIICPFGDIALMVDKLRLFDLLSEKDIPMPKYYAISSVKDLKDSAVYFGYPQNRFVVKLRSSRGARGVFIVEENDPYYSLENLCSWKNLNLADTIAMEYLPGPAYDVDVLAKNGELLCIVPRRREWENALSPSSEGCVVENSEALTDFVRRIVRVLELHGVYDFDCGTTMDGKPAIYEINPRFSGAVAAGLGAGVNIPVMLVKMLLGMDVPNVKVDFGVHMRPVERKITFDDKEYYTIYEMSFYKKESHICR